MRRRTRLLATLLEAHLATALAILSPSIYHAPP